MGGERIRLAVFENYVFKDHLIYLLSRRKIRVSHFFPIDDVSASDIIQQLYSVSEGQFILFHLLSEGREELYLRYTDAIIKIHQQTHGKIIVATGAMMAPPYEKAMRTLEMAGIAMIARGFVHLSSYANLIAEKLKEMQ